MSDTLQWLLVYAAVLWCLLRVMRRYAPQALWQWQARLSYCFERRDAAWAKRIGRALRPAVVIPQGCQNHCRSCRSCA